MKNLLCSFGNCEGQVIGFVIRSRRGLVRHRKAILYCAMHQHHAIHNGSFIRGGCGSMLIVTPLDGTTPKGLVDNYRASQRLAGRYVSKTGIKRFSSHYRRFTISHKKGSG